MNYQRVSFIEIKHLLPADSWAAWRNEVHAGEFDKESVLVFEKSVTLKTLNLDAPFKEAEHVFLILVKGDLTVDKYVYNEDTDGATGLIVLGNLRAATMLVGGQEIYVTGNLTVDEVFWGDYNHGDLRVSGDVVAAVFAETDGYSVSIGGLSEFGVHLTPYGADGQWIGLDAGLLKTVLIQAFIFSDEDGEVSLVRDAGIVRHLDAGHSLLNLKPDREGLI